MSALQRDGVVVIKNAIEPAHYDKLRERMLPDVYELVKTESTYLNFEDEEVNVSQIPTFYPGYIFRDIMANPVSTAVLKAVLGPLAEWRQMHGNTAMKAEKRKVVHADEGWDFYDFPTGIVTNTMHAARRLPREWRRGALIGKSEERFDETTC